MTGTDVATYTRERPGMSAFVLEDGVVYHTYSTYARGLDGLWGMYQWLDRAPKGRNETGIWWRRHDEYEPLPQNAGSCCHGGGARVRVATAAGLSEAANFCQGLRPWGHPTPLLPRRIPLRHDGFRLRSLRSLRLQPSACAGRGLALLAH